MPWGKKNRPETVGETTKSKTRKKVSKQAALKRFSEVWAWSMVFARFKSSHGLWNCSRSLLLFHALFLENLHIQSWHRFAISGSYAIDLAVDSPDFLASIMLFKGPERLSCLCPLEAQNAKSTRD